MATTHKTTNVLSYITTPSSSGNTTSETKPTIPSTLVAKYDLLLALLAQAKPLAESLSSREFNKATSSAINSESSALTSPQTEGLEDPLISEINEILAKCRGWISELKSDVAVQAALQFGGDSGYGTANVRGTGGDKNGSDVQLRETHLESVERGVRKIEVSVELRKFFEEMFWANQVKGKGGIKGEEEGEEKDKGDMKEREEEEGEEKEEEMKGEEGVEEKKVKGEMKGEEKEGEEKDKEQKVMEGLKKEGNEKNNDDGGIGEKEEEEDDDDDYDEDEDSDYEPDEEDDSDDDYDDEDDENEDEEEQENDIEEQDEKKEEH